MGALGIDQHTSRRYNAELERLRSQVMAMGGLVEQQMDHALAALADHDIDRGERVGREDYRVNAMEVGIDEQCAHILARRQPTASDLRLVVTVIKTITDLERIGDEAKKVGAMAAAIAQSGDQAARMEASRLDDMGSSVKQLVHEALDAFARMDPDAALATVRNDSRVDAYHQKVQRRLIDRMVGEPGCIDAMLSVCWAARSLERMGDHAKNIAEYVVYLVYGKDIRHTHPEAVTRELPRREPAASPDPARH